MWLNEYSNNTEEQVYSCCVIFWSAWQGCYVVLQVKENVWDPLAMKNTCGEPRHLIQLVKGLVPLHKKIVILSDCFFQSKKPLDDSQKSAFHRQEVPEVQTLCTHYLTTLLSCLINKVLTGSASNKTCPGYIS